MPSTPRREVALIVLLLGALYLVGLGSMGLMDYDEAAYAETARRMVRSGDHLTPRLADEEFFEKPPLLYWWIAVGYRVLGVNEWGARIPSALATLLTALLLHRSLRRLGRAAVALPAALVFGLGLQVFGLARLALTDAGLTLLMTAILLLAFRAVTRDGPARWGTILAIGVAGGLAVLAKGFIGLVLPAAILGTFLVVRGSLREGLRRLAPFRTLLVAALVAAPWFALMVREHGAARFFEEFFIRHHVERFVKPMEGHKGPPFYYLGVLLVGFFPWVTWIPHAVVAAWPRRGGGRAPDGSVRPLDAALDLPLFALIWAGLVLVFFTVSGTKLPQYIAPAFPALAILVGMLLPRLREAGRAASLVRWPRRILAGLSLVLGATMLAIPVLVEVLRESLTRKKLDRNPFLLEPVGTPAPLIAAGVALAAFGVLLIVLGRRPGRLPSLLLGGAVTILAALIWLGPCVDRYVAAPLRSLSREAGALTPPGGVVVVLGLKRVPSIAFYADRAHVRIRKRKAGTLRDMVAEGRSFAGLAPRPEIERIARVAGLRIVREEGGYVLFSNVD